LNGPLSPPPSASSWYCDGIGWPLQVHLLLMLLAAAVCCWQLQDRAARERRFATLLAVVVVLVTLPAWLGLGVAGMEFNHEFFREMSTYPHEPIPEEAYAAPWAYALIPLHVGLILCVPGYVLAIGILSRRALASR
jgi:hypothetical protein